MKAILRNNVEIDLHGLTHGEVEDKLENWLILQYNLGNFPLHVITGNSSRMKQLVELSATRRGFEVSEPLDNNSGVLLVS
jgi:DNA-nicking Smr family endonuclease